jgi:hypothetical protein
MRHPRHRALVVNLSSLEPFRSSACPCRYTYSHSRRSGLTDPSDVTECHRGAERGEPRRVARPCSDRLPAGAGCGPAEKVTYWSSGHERPGRTATVPPSFTVARGATVRATGVQRVAGRPATTSRRGTADRPTTSRTPSPIRTGARWMTISSRRLSTRHCASHSRCLWGLRLHLVPY